MTADQQLDTYERCSLRFLLTFDNRLNSDQ